MTPFFSFLRDQRGAVNVDWVALASSLLLLGIAVIYVIYGSGVFSVVSDVNSTLKRHSSEVPVGSTPDLSSL